jgi:hypothetical protein
MNVEKLGEFKAFVDKEILPAAAELEPLHDRSRRHLQKLVYTNLVDRFDSMVDSVLMDNCREDLLVEQASKNLTKQVTEAELVKLFVDTSNVQTAIETKVKDALRNSVLRERHSKKLRVLFELFQRDEDCWNKPRVNIATGEVYNQMTPQQGRNIPYSICGYADWLYARRNAIVHGTGATKSLLQNDVQQLKKLFNCVPAKSVRIKPASVKIAATFYKSVMHLLTP